MSARLAWVLVVAALVGAALILVTREVLEHAVSPGPLSAAHAGLIGRCLACHVPFDKRAQNRTCVACHTRVGRDIANRTGFHGRTPQLRDQACSACHDEHRGATAAIVQLDRRRFDHRLTDFILSGAHRAVPCRSCHLPNRPYALAPSACVACHTRHDVHQGRLGSQCATCHDARSWHAIHGFDHAVTRYPLVGRHGRVTCLGCHIGGRLAPIVSTCIACHARNDVHHGTRGTNCAACHTPAGWRLAAFDHTRDTRFALVGCHARVSCIACHGPDLVNRRPPMTCIACHAGNDVHHGVFGPACATCHAPTRWADLHFDHAATGFALRGTHSSIACAACHRAPAASRNLPTTCFGCHQAADAHAGRLGRDCAACHVETAWRVGIRFDHGLARFALSGGHARLACVACHADRRFAAKGVTCAACHPDNVHRGTLGRAPDCADCHIASTWSRTHFDHGRQTRFALVGRHAGLACIACHRQAAATARLDAGCISCHRADDAHHGAFGSKCGTCHTPAGFRPATLPPRLGGASTKPVAVAAVASARR